MIILSFEKCCRQSPQWIHEYGSQYKAYLCLNHDKNDDNNNNNNNNNKNNDNSNNDKIAMPYFLRNTRLLEAAKTRA